MTTSDRNEYALTQWIAIGVSLLVFAAAGYATLSEPGVSLGWGTPSTFSATIVSLAALFLACIGLSRVPMIAVTFSISASALVTMGVCSLWDGVATCLMILGWTIHTSHRTRWMRTGAAIATGMLVIGFLFASGIPLAEAFAIPEKLSRTGPQNAWRMGAEVADMLMPGVVLGLVAIWLRMGSDHIHTDRDHLREWLAIGWVIIHIAWSICLPRVAISHGIVVAVPFFILAGAGWRAFRTLGTSRANGGDVVFAAMAYLTLAWLAWPPIRVVSEAFLAAIG